MLMQLQSNNGNAANVLGHFHRTFGIDCARFDGPVSLRSRVTKHRNQSAIEALALLDAIDSDNGSLLSIAVSGVETDSLEGIVRNRRNAFMQSLGLQQLCYWRFVCLGRFEELHRRLPPLVVERLADWQDQCRVLCCTPSEYFVSPT
jgi:hypothetical protein